MFKHDMQQCNTGHRVSFEQQRSHLIAWHRATAVQARDRKSAISIQAGAAHAAASSMQGGAKAAARPVQTAVIANTPHLVVAYLKVLQRVLRGAEAQTHVYTGYSESHLRGPCQQWQSLEAKLQPHSTRMHQVLKAARAQFHTGGSAGRPQCLRRTRSM